MKPSRAAALALVGWYLILPLPVRAAGSAVITSAVDN